MHRKRVSVDFSWYIRIQIPLPGCVALAVFDKEVGEESEKAGKVAAVGGALTRTSWSSWRRHRSTDEHLKVSHCLLLMLKCTPCVEIEDANEI